MLWIRADAKFTLTLLGFENTLSFVKAVKNNNRGETMLYVDWLSKEILRLEV